MVDVGVEFDGASPTGGDGSSDSEQEHEIPNLFQFPDSILGTSRDVGVANDLLSDELCAFSGDELLTGTEGYALAGDTPWDPQEEPPRKKLRCLDTAASTLCTDEGTLQGPSSHAAEEQDPALGRLGLTTHAYEPQPLPPEWVAVVHSSGGVVYLHKPTRVCTWSRPYLVTSGTIKKHRVPVQGIPCLEKWLFHKERCQLAEKWHQQAGDRKGMLIKLEPQRLKEYLSMRWSSDHLVELAEGRNPPTRSILQLESERKVKPKKQQPKALVPEDLSKVVHVNIPKQYWQLGAQTDGKKQPKVWSVNTSTKTATSLLYEFCQQYLRATPIFTVEETSSVQLPFLCTVCIGGMVYSSGQATTKKQAKHAAAEETLDLFLPGVFRNRLSQSTLEEEFKYLSSVAIDDRQASQLLEQVGLPLPWQVLKECCHRNQGLLQGELLFTLEPTTSEKQQLVYKLSLGEHHTVTGTCTSKKEGQQLGAQAMLKELHPYVSDWGALLRIYSESFSKRKPLSKTTELPTAHYGGDKVKNVDLSVLNRLKQEMQKLADEAKQRRTGSVHVADDLQHKHLHLNIMTTTP